MALTNSFFSFRKKSFLRVTAAAAAAAAAAASGNFMVYTITSFTNTIFILFSNSDYNTLE